MSWSLRVARVRGIDIKLHASFVFILLLGAAQWGLPHGLPGALFGMAVMSLLFVCVALHELGHSVVAQTFGVEVREILLLPIGGVARLSSEPRKPLHELLIAVAGPMVNVLIAVPLLFLALGIFGFDWFFSARFAHQLMAPPSAEALLATLLIANVGLALFNMLPALPMDGGRVLRASLSFLFGKLRATELAATVGQLLSGGLVLLGFSTSNVIMMLIGVFVFLGAGQERRAARAVAALTGLRAGHACDPLAKVLSPGDQLGTVLHYAMRSPQPYYAVAHGNRVVGTISREQLLAQLPRVGPGAYIAGLMQRDIVEVDADAPLVDVRERLMAMGGLPLLVRSRDGSLLGLVGFEDLVRIANLAGALQKYGVVREPSQEPAGRVSVI